MDARKLVAEALGTFWLVLGGCGAAVLAGEHIGAHGVALAFGLTVLTGAAALGHVSGGHFNPAVSLGAALAGRIGFLDMLAYWVAQVVGALLAALVLFVSVPSGLAAALTGNSTAGAQDLFATVSNGWGEQSPLFAQTEPYTTQAGLPTITFDLKTALLLEAIGTAIFVAVILGVTGRKAAAQTAPFAIGGTLGAMILVTGLVTNAGLNPARSTAAAIFAGGDALGQLWVFWLAPFLGAAIVGLLVMAFAPAPAAPYDPDTYDPYLDGDEAEETDEVDVVEHSAVDADDERQ